MIDNSDIKITNLEYYKVGSDDCEIYLGGIKLYPLNSPTPVYEEEYLTIMNVGNMYHPTEGSVGWRGSTSANTLSYSLDGGTTWSTPSTSFTLTLSVGKTIMFKGQCVPSIDHLEGVGHFVTNSCYTIAYGNIMSILYGDNFIGQSDLTGYDNAFSHLFDNNGISGATNLVLPATTLANFCYYGMFYECNALVAAPAVLPATTLANYCYGGMFAGCDFLTAAPELPATTLAHSCYESMFYHCISLTSAPSLPATTLADWCYYAMFSGCTSLNSITCLATDISASIYTTNWVSDVASTGTFYKHPSMTGWTTGDSGIPTNWTVQDAEIPEPLTFIVQEAGTFQFIKNGTGNDIQYSINGGAWTTLASNTNTPALASGDTIAWKATLTPNQDYNGIGRFTSSGRFAVEGNAMSMLYGDDFEDETSLYGKNYAFGRMFSGCTGLTAAENMLLPATTLSRFCYLHLFKGCTGLTTAPELPATTLASECYWGMFSGCTSLSSITCLATDISAPSCTTKWVKNVASSGTFYKSPSMSSWTRGDDGIPTFWTVQDAT